MTFYPLENLDKLFDGYRKAFKVNGLNIMLLQHEGSPYLLETFCPHAGYPMLDAPVIDGELRCPFHGYLFDLASGACTFSVEGPCRGMHSYEVKIQDQQVGVVL